MITPQKFEYKFYPRQRNDPCDKFEGTIFLKAFQDFGLVDISLFLVTYEKIKNRRKISCSPFPFLYNSKRYNINEEVVSNIPIQILGESKNVRLETKSHRLSFLRENLEDIPGDFDCNEIKVYSRLELQIRKSGRNKSLSGYSWQIPVTKSHVVMDHCKPDKIVDVVSNMNYSTLKLEMNKNKFYQGEELHTHVTFNKNPELNEEYGIEVKLERQISLNFSSKKKRSSVITKLLDSKRTFSNSIPKRMNFLISSKIKIDSSIFLYNYIGKNFICNFKLKVEMFKRKSNETINEITVPIEIVSGSTLESKNDKIDLAEIEFFDSEHELDELVL